MSTVRYEELGRNIVTSIAGPLAASFLCNTNSSSSHAHLVRYRHALRENAPDLFREHAVIEFLVKEGNSAGVIYERVGYQQCQKVGETF
jgi:hypothetical protein